MLAIWAHFASAGLITITELKLTEVRMSASAGQRPKGGFLADTQKLIGVDGEIHQRLTDVADHVINAFSSWMTCLICNSDSALGR